MQNFFETTLFQRQTLISIFIMFAMFATIMTLLLPYFQRNPLKNRMKSVALEREALRARERARMANDKERGISLRHQQKAGIRDFVEKLDLRRALADEKTVASLRQAGFRGQNPLNIFLFMRFILPFAFLALAIFMIFGLGILAQQSTFVRFSSVFLPLMPVSMHPISMSVILQPSAVNPSHWPGLMPST